jgi:hypothetical protein
MGMVEIIADFIQYGGNINNPRATIMILKYISRETDIILVPQTYSYLVQTRRAGQQQRLM